MIILALILAAISLTAFMVVVAGVQATERRQSFNDPSGDGWAAQFARSVLGARICPPPADEHREDRSARRERVRA